MSFTARVRVKKLGSAKEFGQRHQAQENVALELGASWLIANSADIIPWDTGEMYKSGRITRNRGNKTFGIIYDAVGANGYPYPARQYNDTSLNHDANRTDHWIEKLVEERGEELNAVVLGALRPVGSKRVASTKGIHRTGASYSRTKAGRAQAKKATAAGRTSRREAARVAKEKRQKAVAKKSAPIKKTSRTSRRRKK